MFIFYVYLFFLSQVVIFCWVLCKKTERETHEYDLFSCIFILFFIYVLVTVVSLTCFKGNMCEN